MREATAVNVLPAIAALEAAKGAGAAELGEISAELRSIVAPLLALQPMPEARQVTTRRTLYFEQGSGASPTTLLCHAP